MKADRRFAEILSRKAPQLADAAAKHLMAADGEIRSRYGDEAQSIWCDHFHERILELSTAISLGRPLLFSTRVVWSKTAMLARGARAQDIDASLSSLMHTLEQAFSTAELELVRRYFDPAERRQDKVDPSLSVSLLDAGLAPDRLALQYLQSVLSGNVIPAMEMVLDSLEDGLSVRDIYVQVLLPVLAEVGRLWHINDISVAEEHLVTGTTQRLMAVLASHAPRKPDRGKTVVAAGVSGNVHDIGIRTLAYFFEFEGWRTIYLGPDTPRSEVASSVSIYQADLVLLSAGLSTQLESLHRTILNIRSHKKDSIIMVGGNAFSETPELWTDLGADGFADDMDEALRLAEELMSD